MSGMFPLPTWLLLLLMLIITTHAQYYNIETDMMYATDTVAIDVPYTQIHRTMDRVKTQTFYSTVNNSARPFTTIQCRHYKDFYLLLYSMCLRSVLCAEMYYMDQSTVSNAVDKVNFKKFVYQLSLSQLFIVENHGDESDGGVTGTGGGGGVAPQLFLLEDNVPLEWIPRYLIRLENTPDVTPCHTTFNLSAPENAAFVHSTLYLLHAYKYYVVNDYRCDHYNQWLVLDSHNRPVCWCKHGKACDTDSNYRILIIILTSIMLLLVTFGIIGFFVTTPRILRKIDEVNRSRLSVRKERV